MDFDPATAEPVAAQSGFDPGSAKPVTDAPAGAGKDSSTEIRIDPNYVPPTIDLTPKPETFDAKSAQPVEDEEPEKPNPTHISSEQWQKADADTSGDVHMGRLTLKLGRLKLLLSHPWDKYNVSVEGGFDGVKIPRVEADQGTGVVNRAKQVGAAGTNVVTGAAGGILSPGGVSSLIPVTAPATILYSAPHFVASGAEHIYDAVKGAWTGKAGLQETTEKLVGGTLEVAGGAHGLKVAGKGLPGATGLDSDAPPRSPQEAMDALRAEAAKTDDPQAKAALEGAALKVAQKTNEGAPFDVATAKPVTAEAEFDPASAKPVSTPDGAGPETELAGDYDRYQEIQGEMSRLTKEGKGMDDPEVKALWTENEQLKNRNSSDPGMPPEAPGEVRQTEFDFDAPQYQGAEPPVLPTKAPGDYGIAARVTAERAKGGSIEPVAAGEGIGAEAAVNRGRSDLQGGADPQAALDRFNDSGSINDRDIGLVRAQGEKLAQAASAAAREHGVESPEYDAAAKADSEWTKAIKPMQTAWHRAGQVMQGSTDLNTGDFHSLHTAYTEATGKDFTPEQAGRAKKVAAEVTEATDAAEAAKQKVLDTISKEVPEPPIPRSKQIVDSLKVKRDAALERIAVRLAKLTSLHAVEPEDVGSFASAQNLADMADVGAYHLAKGVTDFGEWSKRMVEDIGEAVRPHLDAIFSKAKEAATESDRSVAGIWQRAKDYIERGETDFAAIRQKIATDLGIPVDEVSEKLAQPKGTRTITNDMYAKMSRQRAVVESAKAWLKNEQTPTWLKIMRALPGAFFKLYTFGHGTVGMITHNAISMFNPYAWKSYWPNFFRQFKLIGLHDRGAFHEQMMQDLEHDPNFITARRAGLANDPRRYTDDYQKSWLGNHLEKIGLTGNRGFDALKLFRQDMFNRTWDSLPKSLQTKAYSELLADSINHASGAIKAKFPEWSNWAFFAPKLEGSRWAWMIGDPLKASRIFKEWSKSTPEEQAFAVRELKQKATITGIYFGLLAMNQGLLQATGSKQSVNFTDPSRSDFLSFKAGGMKFGVIGPMLGMVRLFANLLHDTGYFGEMHSWEKGKDGSDLMATDIKDYVRGKLSPFAGVATDVATQTDFQGRPLPFSNKPVPSRLQKQGIGKYTYGEYAGEHLMPIPVSETLREVWSKQGMSESQIDHLLKALASGILTGSTGARMGKDAYEGRPAGTQTPGNSKLHRAR